MSLLDRVRIALGDEEELARLAAELEANRVRVGDYGWIGNTCLQCESITPEGSHLTREVAHAVGARNLYGERLWVWECPACGCGCRRFGEEIPVRHDPRCDDCRCPPTLRDPGLPPAPSGMSDVGTGDAIEE